MIRPIRCNLGSSWVKRSPCTIHLKDGTVVEIRRVISPNTRHDQMVGIDLSGTELTIPIIDIEDVEVLQGPCAIWNVLYWCRRNRLVFRVSLHGDPAEMTESMDGASITTLDHQRVVYKDLESGQPREFPFTDIRFVDIPWHADAVASVPAA